MNKHVHQYQVKVLRQWFYDQRPKIAKGLRDLYFSDHFIERVVERNLVKDKEYLAVIIARFMHEVFYRTTYNARSYRVEWRGLKVCLSIDLEPVSKRRQVNVKTAFENDGAYECDEVISLR